MLPFSAGKTIWDELPETNIDVQKLEHLFESRAKDLISKVRTCDCMPLYVLRFWESTFLHQFTVSIFSNSIFCILIFLHIICLQYYGFFLVIRR